MNPVILLAKESIEIRLFGMNSALKELVKISRRVGRDARLTQGAAGNTSVKTADGRFMFVKASGTALADMSAKRGWRKINLQKVRGIIKDKKLAKLPLKKRETEVVRRLLAACEDNIKAKFRPSIETNLHAFLDKYVIHLHPIAVGAFVSSKNGKAELEKLFAKEKFPPLWVSYANPGFALAEKIANLNSQYKKKHKRLPQILFLEKHGLFVSATTAKEALKLVWKVIKRCEKKIKEASPCRRRLNEPRQSIGGANRHSLRGNDKRRIKKAKLIIEDAFFAAAGQRRPVHFFYNNIISAFAKNPDTGRLLEMSPLNPDEIIYCNGPAIWLEKPQKDKITASLKKQIAKGQKPAIAFLVKNLGLFVIGSVKSTPIAEQVVCGSLFIRYNAKRFGGIIALTKSEQDFIYNCGA